MLSNDRKIFRAMVEKESFKYLHYNIFANIFPKKLIKYSDNGLLEEKLQEFCKKDYSKYSKNEKKEIQNILFSLISLQKIINEEIKKIYADAKVKYLSLSIKEQSTFLYAYKKEFKNQFFNNVRGRVLKALDKIFEKKEKCKILYEEELLNDILNIGRSAVHEWYNAIEEKPISSEKRKHISMHFGYTNAVWGNINSPDLNDIKKKLDYYKQKDIFSSIDDLLKFNQQINCEFQDIQFIQKPQDSFDYFQNALYYRKNRKYKKALEIIEKVLRYDDMFVFKCYKKILHQKAILLSTDDIKAFKDALKILKHLHYSMNYSQQEPEVVTLIASNYKRLALIEENGNYKQELEEKDIDNLILAIEFYNISYKYREELNKKDRFYDLLNILYLEKILTLFNNEKFLKENFFAKYGKFNLKDYTLNLQDWWELISFIEYKILLCEISKDKIKEQLESYFNGDINNINPDFITITLRQVKLYLTVVKNIDNINAQNDCSIELFEALVDYLEEIVQYVKLNEKS